MAQKKENKGNNDVPTGPDRWYGNAVVLSRQGDIKFITRQLAHFLGFQPEYLIGKNAISLFIDKEEQQQRQSQLDFLYKQESIVNQFSVKLRDARGNPVRFLFNIIKIDNPEQDIALIGDNLHETTYLGNQELNEGEVLQGMLAQGRKYILVIDANEKVTSVNEKAKSELGISPGSRLKELLDHDLAKKTSAFLNSLSNLRSTANINLTITNPKSGQQFYLEGTVSSILSGKNLQEFRLVLRDISEQVKTEKARKLYYAIAHHSIHSDDLQSLFLNIYRELRQVVDCENMYIALKEEEDGRLYLNFPFFKEGEDIRWGHTRRPYGRGLTEHIIEEGQARLYDTTTLKRLVSKQKLNLHGRLPKVWLGVPLRVKEEVIGVIAVQSYKHNSAFTARDLKLLDFASSQIAMAVDKLRTQEKLQAQTAKLNSIIESSSHLIWTVNKELNLTSFNKNYFEAIINNYDDMPDIQSSEDGRSQSFDEFWQEKYRQAFTGKSLNFEIKLKDKKGNDIWKEIYLNPIFLEDGRIEEVSGIANDITAKKLSEQELKKSEEKFRTIFESFQDVYFRCDRQGNINMVSPSVQELTGLDQQSILGKNIRLFYKNDGSLLPLLRRLLANKQIKNVEVTVIGGKDGPVECICNLNLLTDNHGKVECIEGVVRDITQLKLTNKALIEAKELAESSLKVKEQFLANMSHEIRTPLNGIIGMIDLLEQTTMDSDQERYLHTIKQSSETLLSILNNILDLSKIEAGKMQLRPAPVSMERLTAKLEALFKPWAMMQNIKIKLHLAPELPPVLELDEVRLIQVISNLVSNSIKFTPRGGSIDIGLRVKEKQQKEIILAVDVRDSGIGIKKEDIDKLFNSFTQLDNSTTKPYSGTGLGLSISKKLVEMMGGEIGVFSNPGLGSTFWFTIKARLSAARLKPEPANGNRSQLLKFTDFTPAILVVDDNAVNREVAGEILKKAGCRVELAASGMEAVFKARQNNYDIIFMDIQMPDMDGIEANRQIKNLAKTHRPWVVAMTAYSMQEDQARFLAAGLDDYLAKPIKANQLIGKVREILTGEHSEHEQQAGGNQELLLINPDTLAELRQFGGNEVVSQAIDDFIEEAGTQLAECNAALKKHDYELIRTHLHTLKGSASTLGVEKMAALAREAEARLKKQDFHHLAEDLTALQNNFAAFKKNIANIMHQYQSI